MYAKQIIRIAVVVCLATFVAVPVFAGTRIGGGIHYLKTVGDIKDSPDFDENAIGFLGLVYAFRYGKAIIVSPMVNALPPVITIVLSLMLYQVIPHPVIGTGMVMAVAAALLLAIEPEEQS